MPPRRSSAPSTRRWSSTPRLDQAWEAWTTREGIVSFFAPDAQIEPRVGGAFHIHMDPGGAPGMKGADDMRYMALQPKKMLSFDWNAPPHLAEARAQRTFVVVRFAAVDDADHARHAAPHRLGRGWAMGPGVLRISTVRGATCSAT
ncbi:MAG: SRPBCC domain-containing protein [Comamonadaceae bacterium]|nr:SRPBCC domain-containing protein [Comamonadaceae bacterium]